MNGLSLIVSKGGPPFPPNPEVFHLHPEISIDTALLTLRYLGSTVDPLYPAKTGLYAFSKNGLTQRGIEARKWLYSRPEKVIAVVSHAGFLRTSLSHRMYENADYRIFDFGEGEQNNPPLIERDETEQKGGGLGKSEKGAFPFTSSDCPPEDEFEPEEIGS